MNTTECCAMCMNIPDKLNLPLWVIITGLILGSLVGIIFIAGIYAGAK